MGYPISNSLQIPLVSNLGNFYAPAWHGEAIPVARVVQVESIDFAARDPCCPAMVQIV